MTGLSDLFKFQYNPSNPLESHFHGLAYKLVKDTYPRGKTKEKIHVYETVAVRREYLMT
jgi:hypothetical protein